MDLKTLFADLRAWWGCHEAAGVPRADASGLGHALAEQAGAHVGSVPGLLDNAAVSDGGPGAGGHESWLATSGAVLTGPGSVSLWYKLANLNGHHLLWTQDDGTSVLQAAYFDAANKTINFLVDGLAFSQGVPVGNSAGQWHHLAGTYDGFWTNLYVDGVLVQQNQGPGPFTPGAVHTNLLGDSSAHSGWPVAQAGVQMVGVFGHALDDGGVNVGDVAGGEVAVLYNLGAGLDFNKTGAMAVVRWLA